MRILRLRIARQLLRFHPASFQIDFDELKFSSQGTELTHEALANRWYQKIEQSLATIDDSLIEDFHVDLLKPLRDRWLELEEARDEFIESKDAVTAQYTQPAEEPTSNPITEEVPSNLQ
jgi:hypothetical protein